MNGTIIFCSAFGGVIQADGNYLDQFDPSWINQPAPRDGRYSFSGTGFSKGQRVTFTPNPGVIQSGGTFESVSIATNVSAA